MENCNGLHKLEEDSQQVHISLRRKAFAEAIKLILNRSTINSAIDPLYLVHDREQEKAQI